MCGPQVRFCESWGRATSPGYSTRMVLVTFAETKVTLRRGRNPATHKKAKAVRLRKGLTAARFLN